MIKILFVAMTLEYVTFLCSQDGCRQRAEEVDFAILRKLVIICPSRQR